MKNSRFRKKIKGFTLLEIVITIIVLTILASLGLVYYAKVINKSEDTEALVNLDAIKTAEEIEVTETGTYIDAHNEDVIEEKLGVAIDDKIFTYRVENATELNYTAIAERKKPKKDAPFMIVMSRGSEPVYHYTTQGSYGVGQGGYSGGAGGYISLSGAGGSSGGFGGDFGTGGSNGGSGGSSGGSGTGSGSSDGSGSSGTGGSGENQGSSETGSGNGSGNPGWGGGGSGIYEGVDAALAQAYLTLLASSSGNGLAILLQTNDVTITVGDGEGALAYWDSSINTIVVDSAIAASWTAGGLAALISHEATHVDYTYNPEARITETLTRHPELSEDDLHIDESDPDDYPWNSIDQEYNAFKTEAEVWNEVRDAENNEELDYVSWLLAQGEATAKARIRQVYGGYGLPEY